MRRQISKMLMACVMAMTLMVVSAASAFAAGTGMDWSGDSKITVQGMGVAPTYAVNAIQARMLARRAAVVDAYRQLAEMVKGVNVDSETTVENMMVTSDVTKTKVTALIQGARIVSEQAVDGGGYTVTMEMSVFGASNSLATAVLPTNTVPTSFGQHAVFRTGQRPGDAGHDDPVRHDAVASGLFCCSCPGRPGNRRLHRPDRGLPRPWPQAGHVPGHQERQR